jgi:uncharacterized oligopeptide transporter (OPT) family protein
MLIAITPSPAYIFIGMMVRPITTVYIVLGAVVGWGILSPIAKSKGWAPGPTADWETGSQGWINWVALGLILGDAAVGIIWPIGRTLAARYSVDFKSLSWARLTESSSKNLRRVYRERISKSKGQGHLRAAEVEEPLLASTESSEVDDIQSSTVSDEDQFKLKADSIPPTAMTLWMIVSALLCFGAMWYLFGSMMPLLAIALAVIIIPRLSLVTVRALGETGQGGAESISSFTTPE